MRLDRFTAGKLEDLRLGGSLRGVAADSNGDVYVSRAGGTISGYTDDEGEFGSVSFGKSSDGIELLADGRAYRIVEEMERE